MQELSYRASLQVTPELLLREATPEDAYALYALLDNHRPYMRQWLPFVDYSVSADTTKTFLESIARPDNVTDYVFVIVYRQQVAGLIGFKTVDLINRKLEIGYWLGEPYQGKGLMRNPCEELIRHAFTSMNINRIQIKVAVGNSRSSNIPHKLGFTLEGLERDGELLNGEFTDLEQYSLLKSEWQKQQHNK